MKTTLTIVDIEIPHATAEAIVCHADPLQAYRDYLAERHCIIPSTVTATDMTRLESKFADELGRIELAAMRQRMQIDNDLTLLKAAQ